MPPPSRRLLQRTVRILLECILVETGLRREQMSQNPSEQLFSIWVLFFLHPILVGCLSLDLNNRSVHSISIHPSNNNIICLEKDHHLKCSNGNRWVFTRYSESNGEVIERNLLEDKKMPTGMVSVTMSGFPCLAVSYR